MTRTGTMRCNPQTNSTTGTCDSGTLWLVATLTLKPTALLAALTVPSSPELAEPIG